MRDLVGGTVTQLAPFMASKLVLEMIDLSLEEEKGALVGLEIASYLYAENCDNPRRQRRKLPQVLIAQASSALTQTEILAASKLGLCTNLARHLTNLPGGTLNPRTYSEAVAELFKKSQTVKVEIWQKDRLVKEQMNLLLAVGGAATEAPRFVHVRYRPRQKTNRRPVAIVGKGITFDSGGLDIKPSSAMRWMKKDMGGSAAAVAIAKWAELTELQVPLDIYLPMAENAIASASFRPGDIITARNGLTIEIHNTDAEGRLVLADALDVAVTQTGLDEPEAVINIATLTGAIKVGLGGEVAGLFCNRDDLANELLKAGQTRGDLAWRMPLYQPYKTLFRSTFADYANASDGFAGAITAALFLELFVRNKPWAHLDIYAWREGAGGAWSEAGGSGQPVQALSEFLIRR
jgi:leucyl aminopeptidase